MALEQQLLLVIQGYPTKVKMMLIQHLFLTLRSFHLSIVLAT